MSSPQEAARAADPLAALRAATGSRHARLDGFQDGPGYTYSPRLALIDADLRDAAADQPGTDVQEAYWPVAASAAYRWGVCYVAEGAQLGGAVLYQRLADRLAPHPLRLLRGVEGGPGPAWRAFMQALRTHVRTEAEVADACAGACAAFDRILALAGR